MKKFRHLAVLCLLLAGCSDSTDAPDEQPSVTPPGPTENLCANASCANGCCNGTCVDFRTDVNHCGRCSTQCDAGWSCLDGQCSRECSGETARVCEGMCVNIATNEMHCGGCGRACGPNMVCTGKTCECAEGYIDCDGNDANGCEIPGYECICMTGERKSCYPYVQGKPGVGECRSGEVVCEDSLWSECRGAVGPREVLECTDKDYNCNGIADGQEDRDGDGYTACTGDCCDSKEACTVLTSGGGNMTISEPDKVHPGAWDDPSNGIDDNCDGKLDDGTGENAGSSKSCSTDVYDPKGGSSLGSDAALRLARAMDICDDDGLISAELLLADGSSFKSWKGDSSVCGSKKLITPADQVAVMKDLGGIVKPIANETMAVLSSGKAEGRTNTGFEDCVGTEVSAPKVYLDAHGGVLPASTQCNSTRSDNQANDSIMLRLKLRAPEYANGFSFKFKFFSKEYPEYLCDNYNDFFLALVYAKSDKIPADHNVAFDANHDPVSVNNAFFTECDKAACMKSKGEEMCNSCTDDLSQLKGYVTKTSEAGATGWLKTSVPVSPKEEFTLELIIFDAGQKENKTTTGFGHLRDSLVLLDGFAWQTSSAKLETVVVVN